MLRNNFYARKFNEKMLCIGLEQNIINPTRSTFYSETIIDLVFTNFKITHKVLTTPKISDHNIIYIEIEGVNNVNKNSIV